MILCHGEMLIDFIPTEARDGTLAYRPAVGGSPGNVALTLARLNVPAGFVGGLSTDFFGEQIASTLAANGVSMHYVSRLDYRLSKLAIQKRSFFWTIVKRLGLRDRGPSYRRPA